MGDNRARPEGAAFQCINTERAQTRLKGIESDADRLRLPFERAIHGLPGSHRNRGHCNRKPCNPVEPQFRTHCLKSLHFYCFAGSWFISAVACTAPPVTLSVLLQAVKLEYLKTLAFYKGRPVFADLPVHDPRLTITVR